MYRFFIIGVLLFVPSLLLARSPTSDELFDSVVISEGSAIITTHLATSTGENHYLTNVQYYAQTAGTRMDLYCDGTLIWHYEIYDTAFNPIEVHWDTPLVCSGRVWSNVTSAAGRTIINTQGYTMSSTDYDESGGGAGGSTANPLTVDIPVLQTFWGIALLLVGMVFPIWFFRRKR